MKNWSNQCTALLANDLVKKMCADLILILLDSSRRRDSDDATHIVCTDSTKIHSRFHQIPADLEYFRIFPNKLRKICLILLRNLELKVADFFRKLRTKNKQEVHSHAFYKECSFYSKQKSI